MDEDSRVGEKKKRPFQHGFNAVQLHDQPALGDTLAANPNRSSSSRTKSRPRSEVTRAPWKSTRNLPLNESRKGCSCLSPTAAPPPYPHDRIQTRVYQGLCKILPSW